MRRLISQASPFIPIPSSAQSPIHPDAQQNIGDAVGADGGRYRPGPSAEVVLVGGGLQFDGLCDADRHDLQRRTPIVDCRL